MSECEVMQGMWKEKLDALKKKKEENLSAGIPESPLKLPSDEEMIANAEKQLGTPLGLREGDNKELKGE